LELRQTMNDGGKRKYTDSQILAAFDVVESPETIRRTRADETPPGMI